MNYRIEDEIFASALEASSIKRTKVMYTKAKYPHTCSMCLDDNQLNKIGYKLKQEFVDDIYVPYLFICEECYEELPNE